MDFSIQRPSFITQIQFTTSVENVKDCYQLCKQTQGKTTMASTVFTDGQDTDRHPCQASKTYEQWHNAMQCIDRVKVYIDVSTLQH